MVFTTATGVMIPFMYFCSRGFSANSTTSFLSWMIFPLRYVLVLGIIPILAVILMTKVSSPSRPPRLGSADYLPIREGEMRGGFRFSESLIMWLVISFVVSFQTQEKIFYFGATVKKSSFLVYPVKLYLQGILPMNVLKQLLTLNLYIEIRDFNVWHKNKMFSQQCSGRYW